MYLHITIPTKLQYNFSASIYKQRSNHFKEVKKFILYIYIYIEREGGKEIDIYA